MMVSLAKYLRRSIGRPARVIPIWISNENSQCFPWLLFLSFSIKTTFLRSFLRPSYSRMTNGKICASTTSRNIGIRLQGHWTLSSRYTLCLLMRTSHCFRASLSFHRTSMSRYNVRIGTDFRYLAGSTHTCDMRSVSSARIRYQLPACPFCSTIGSISAGIIPSLWSKCCFSRSHDLFGMAKNALRLFKRAIHWPTHYKVIQLKNDWQEHLVQLSENILRWMEKDLQSGSLGGTKRRSCKWNSSSKFLNFLAYWRLFWIVKFPAKEALEVKINVR